MEDFSVGARHRSPSPRIKDCENINDYPDPVHEEPEDLPDEANLDDADLERDYAELQEEFGFLLDDRDDLEDENEILREQNVALRRLLEEALAETDELQRENEELAALNNRLNDDFEDLVVQLDHVLVLRDGDIHFRDDLQRRHDFNLRVLGNALREREYGRYHIEAYRATLGRYENHRVQMEAWADRLHEVAWELLHQRDELLAQCEDLRAAVEVGRLNVEGLGRVIEEWEELGLQQRRAVYWERRGYMRRD